MRYIDYSKIFESSHFDNMINRIAEIEKLPRDRGILIGSIYADLLAKYNGRIAIEMLSKGFETRAKEYGLSIERYIDDVLKGGKEDE